MNMQAYSPNALSYRRGIRAICLHTHRMPFWKYFLLANGLAFFIRLIGNSKDKSIMNYFLCYCHQALHNKGLVSRKEATCHQE